MARTLWRLAPIDTTATGQIVQVLRVHLAHAALTALLVPIGDARRLSWRWMAVLAARMVAVCLAAVPICCAERYLPLREVSYRWCATDWRRDPTRALCWCCRTGMRSRSMARCSARGLTRGWCCTGGAGGAVPVRSQRCC